MIGILSFSVGNANEDLSEPVNDFGRMCIVESYSSS